MKNTNEIYTLKFNKSTNEIIINYLDKNNKTQSKVFNYSDLTVSQLKFLTKRFIKMEKLSTEIRDSKK